MSLLKDIKREIGDCNLPRLIAARNREFNQLKKRHDKLLNVELRGCAKRWDELKDEALNGCRIGTVIEGIEEKLEPLI